MTTAEDRAAGFWRRFAAHVIDTTLILLLPVLSGVVLGISGALAGVHSVLDGLSGPLPPLVALLALWLYYALQESSWRQATPGKRLMGIEVVTQYGDRRISFARASGAVAHALGWATLGIGFVMAAFTRRKQALHDLFAGTRVVRTGASPSAGWQLFAMILLLSSGGTAWAVHKAWPYFQQLLAREQALQRPAVAAADAVMVSMETYVRVHHALPATFEEAGYQPPDGETAPLVSLDAESGRLAVAMRDGSVIIVLTPVPDSTGHVNWQCEANPDTAVNYPPRCGHD